MLTLAPLTDVQVKSVLIATDFSPASEKPLRHAIAIAQIYEAKFYLLHVVSSAGLTAGGREVNSCPHRSSLDKCPSIGGPTG